MREIEKGIQKIELLDIKQRKFEREADMILSTAAFCQAPPVYHSTLDKVIEITKRKAKIWNSIRNYIVPKTGKTLWQMAVKSILPIAMFGKEEHLDFYGIDIRRNLTL